MSISDKRLVQSQRAGRDTTQQQAGRDVVNITVNFSQAENYLATSREAVIAREHSDVAVGVARQRVVPFDAELVRVLSDRGLLEAFADPAVQRLMTASRIEAASTERDDDRHRLVELVAGRAQSGDRAIRAAVSRAVAVVDDIDEEALRNLTYVIGGGMFAQAYYSLDLSLDRWEERLALIPPCQPRGLRWYEHLDSLGLIRHTTAGVQKFKPLREWMAGWGASYFAVGLPNAEALSVIAECQELVPEVNLPLTPHELKPDFARCFYAKREQVEEHFRKQPAATAHVDALTNLVAESFLSRGDDHSPGPFDEAVQRRVHLASWASTRSTLPHPVTATDVGKTIVWAELRRLGDVSLSLEKALDS